MLGEQTIKTKGGNNDYISRGDVSMVNLTGSLASTTISVCHLYGRSEVKSLSPVFATPGTVAYQAPLSMGFSRQEYWSGLPYKMNILNVKSILSIHESLFYDP